MIVDFLSFNIPVSSLFPDVSNREQHPEDGAAVL